MSESTVEVADYKPGKLVPVTSPIELRERTVRDYARNARRAGIDVSTSELEKLAVYDCQLADAYSRGVDHSPPRTRPRKKVERKPQIDPDLKFAAPMPSYLRDRPGAYYLPPVQVSARWPFAMGRLKRILAGASQHPDPMKVVETCEMPLLARDVMRLHGNWLGRGRESRHNPFRGLSDADAMRMLVRSIEDICDRSASKMGPWWVPK